MPWFDYIAQDPEGRRVPRRDEAASLAALRERLAAEGWRFLSLEPPAPGGAPILSAEEVFLVTDRVAEITQNRWPLVAGLWALTEDTPEPRVRRALRRLCLALEDGAPLDAAWTAAQPQLPGHLVAVIQAGLDSGRLGEMIVRHNRALQQSREIRARTFRSLFYPVILLGVMLVELLGLFLVVVPQFKKVLVDFDTELPGITVGMIELSDALLWLGWWGVLIAVALLGLFVALFCVRRVRSWLAALLYSAPLVGDVLRLTTLTRFTTALASLLKARRGLPESLVWAGEAAGEPYIAKAAAELAEGVKAGHDLADCADDQSKLPRSLRHLFRWSQRGDAFPDLLEGASEMYFARARLHAHQLIPFLEPLLLMLTLSAAGWVIVSLFMPLFKLLNELS